MKKNKGAPKESEGRSQFYLPFSKKDDDDVQDKATPSPSEGTQSRHQSPTERSTREKPNFPLKPRPPPKPPLGKSYGTLPSASSSDRSGDCGIPLRSGTGAGSGEGAVGEVELRKRHTFPKEMGKAEEFEQSEDSDDDGARSLESLDRLSCDDDPVESERILKRRKLMLTSLNSYFKKMMENMFPKPSEVKDLKTATAKEKPKRRKGQLFQNWRGKKTSSDPLQPSSSQSDFLTHLAEETGEEYKPEDIPDLLESLGGIRFSDLMKLQSEEQPSWRRSKQREVKRAPSVFIQPKEMEGNKILPAPRVESSTDNSGKMTRRLSVPSQPHKLMLLKELFSSTSACKVTIEEREGRVVFEGSPEAVKQTSKCFQEQLDELVEDRRDFSKTMTSIFRSPTGQVYLRDVTSAHNDCKLHVGNSFLLCAGMSRTDVRGCLTEIESDVRMEPIQVSGFSHQDLERLRKQIEEEYLARLLYRDADDGEVLLEGVGQDVNLARGFILRQVEEYQKDTDIFLIKGQARAKCFKYCFAEKLNEVKAIIRESKGSLDERFENDRFMLTYQVRQGKIREVQMRLKIIMGSILEESLDLKEEFSDIVDQCLLLEGFRKTDVKTFQASFERTVREQCFVEISITSKRWGNVARPDPLAQIKMKEAEPAKKLNPLLNWYYTGRLTSGPFHKSIIIRNTLVTVMSGDITTVTADVLVSPVARDLNMSKTAVGKALVKRFGKNVQEELSYMKTPCHHSDVIECPLPPDQLPVCALYLVVLEKWSASAVSENIKTLVKTCLALAEENRCTSIAFPLLGCGKKFKLHFNTVMAAMIEATRAALAKAPAGTSLQKLTFVLHSIREAQSFAQQLDYLTPVANEHQEMTSELQESGDWLLEKLASTLPKAEETSGVLLMAHLYGPSRDILTTARARLVQELRQGFLYEDSIEHAGLLQLSQRDTGEIRTAAQLDSVIITRPPTGGSCLRLKGEHQAVLKLKEVIQGKLLHSLQLHVPPPTSDQSSPRLGRAVSYHLPAYWSITANPTILNEAVQNRYKLVDVTEEERTALENLVRGTWMPDLVGAGFDAVGLRHRSVDVIKVQRVENPSLYENYYNRRTTLQREISEAGKGCKPVNSLPMSSGPVQTTALLTTGNPLFRELHLDLNEHYLFHGTSAQNLQAILRYGPDARLASTGGMLGSGIYFAEAFTKSDRYADDRNRRTAGEKTVFLMRVLLGSPFINSAVIPNRYLRPPCKVCKKDRCREMHGGFFDSVIDDCLTLRAFRELIVYESALCYPEYLITYLRQG